MNHPNSGISEKEPSYMRATGKLPYTLINDYMFKALLQKNENVLKHLICSLLHLRPEEVRSVEVRNPILLGTALTEDFDSKTFILDINVLLNDHTLINLEMQVADYKNWPERSMTYLCRNFDQLQSGNDYVEVKPTIHIGFLDFTLFREQPEFYATYKMMNVKSHNIFTDKIALSVVNLKHIELATQEDREWEIDYWASLFKATTWEELKMLAERNQVMGDAVNTIYELTADESIREQCKAREKHIKEMNTILKEREMAERARDAMFQQLEQTGQQLEQAEQQLEQAEQQLEQAEQQLEQAEQQLEQTGQQLEQTGQQLEQAEQQLEQTGQQLEQKEQQLEQAEQQLEQTEQQLEQKEQQLEQAEQQIAKLLQEIQQLKRGQD